MSKATSYACGNTWFNWTPNFVNQLMMLAIILPQAQA